MPHVACAGRSAPCTRPALAGAILLLSCMPVLAAEEVQAPQVEVLGHCETGIGTSDASSEGAVTHKLIEDRPILRPGEILESVPGMVVSGWGGVAREVSSCWPLPYGLAAECLHRHSHPLQGTLEQ